MQRLWVHQLDCALYMFCPLAGTLYMLHPLADVLYMLRPLAGAYQLQLFIV